MLYVCMCVCVYVHLGVCRGQNWLSDPLELELAAVVNHVTLVPRIKLRSSARSRHSQLLSHLPGWL